jgi:hypothetical protein
MAVVKIPYTPRPYQREIHNFPTPFGVVIAHRRCGKTVSFANHLIRAVLKCPLREPQVAYIAPSQTQARRIVWRYLLHYTAPIPERRVQSGELTITLPGERRIMVLGAENVHALRGIYLDSVVLDEFAQMRPEAWDEVIFPTLLDRNGSALIGGTPMGENRLKEIWDQAASDPDWSRMMLTVDKTGALTPEAIERARRAMSPARFAQEFMCSFNAVIEGAYYSELMGKADASGRVGSVPYDPALGVTVAVDLGMADAFAAWFLQESPGGEVRAIAYREWTYYEGYAQIKRDIDAMGYAVTRWIAPHDIGVTEQGTGKSRREQARELGMPFETAPRMTLEDGIEAVRVLLPRMRFDQAGCKDGIACLRQYRADWDPVKKIGTKKPLHDWTSHGADALRTYAVARAASLSDPTRSTRELELELAAARMGRVAGQGYGRARR